MFVSASAWDPVHGVYAILLAVVVVVWAVAELRQAVKFRPEARNVDWRNELVVRVILIGGSGATIGIFLHASFAEIRPTALASILGLCVVYAGVGLRVWSFRTLGRFFTLTIVTSGDQPVIDRGPYRVLRHPSYTGVLLLLIGIGFLIGNWFAVLGLGVSGTAGFAYRIRVEERVLRRDLGDRYVAFAATRKRLIPFIW